MGIYAFVMWCRSDNEWPFEKFLVTDEFHGYADVVFVPAF